MTDVKLIQRESEYDSYRFEGEDDVEAIDFDEQNEIRNLLLGRTVQKVADDHLLLDDGTLLKIVPNQGGCACSAGDYFLTDLNEVDNVVTAVDFKREDREWGEYDWEAGEYATTFSIFVVAEDKKLRLARIDGDDGNGYYGTGYTILVRRTSDV